MDTSSSVESYSRWIQALEGSTFFFEEGPKGLKLLKLELRKVLI